MVVATVEARERNAELQRCGLNPLSSARLSAERRREQRGPGFSRDELLRAVSKIARRELPRPPRGIRDRAYSTVVM